MSWLHGTAAGLSFACCLVALLGRKWGAAAQLFLLEYAATLVR